MALNRRSCRLIVESGALQAISTVCKGEIVERSVDLCREICALLRNLSLNEDNKVAILQQCLKPLERFMHHSDAETSHQAVGIIANIAEDSRNQGVLVNAGIIQRLKHVLRHDENPALIREAVRWLSLSLSLSSLSLYLSIYFSLHLIDLITTHTHTQHQLLHRYVPSQTSLQSINSWIASPTVEPSAQSCRNSAPVTC